MKKYGLRVLVGLIAFTVGISAVVWMFQLRTAKNYISQIKLQNDYPTSLVTIKYRGFREFEVTNTSSMTMYYRSRWKESHEHNEISVNGKESIRKGYCGNVAMQMKEFLIEPNEIRTFEVDYFDFRRFSEKEKNQNVKVGFDFRFGDFDNYKTFWSEDFQLPKSVKDEIKKHQ